MNLISHKFTDPRSFFLETMGERVSKLTAPRLLAVPMKQCEKRLPMVLGPGGQESLRIEAKKLFPVKQAPLPVKQAPLPAKWSFETPGGSDWTMEEMLKLMAWGRDQGMSDLIFTSSDRPYMRLAGKWRGLGRRLVHLTELTTLLNHLTRNEAAGSMVGSGLELDFGCEIPEGRFQRLRFRGNATAVADGWTTGLSVTLRVLPDLPPELSSLSVEPELIEAFFPDNGLVLVTGVMGSGKSTLLAAALRQLAETGHRHIATYEAPIEFDLAGLPNRISPVEQTEIPRHLGGFVAAARNVTRRAADAVLIGEARDPQTIRSLMEAAEIGVTAYTTVHTRSVADTPSRIIGVFDQAERASLKASLFSAIRVIVQQRLYPAVGGGRRAVREFLVFNQQMRSLLQRESLSNLPMAIEELVQIRGQSLEKAVRREVALGHLSSEALESVLAEKRGLSAL